ARGALSTMLAQNFKTVALAVLLPIGAAASGLGILDHPSVEGPPAGPEVLSPETVGSPTTPPSARDGRIEPLLGTWERVARNGEPVTPENAARMTLRRAYSSPQARFNATATPLL